ncbi:MAG: site-2 protease family protein [Ignavibacteriales bacterium]|nr:site-2 protease family protein [Ignavibacteriales bacterium]
MPDYFSEPYFSTNEPREKKKEKHNFVLHIFLFIITFVTTTISGMQWIKGFGGPYEISSFVIGLPYSISILFVLASHEFGHYFAAMYHKVKATLPFFIPLPSVEGFFINFGTMGAVIKTKTAVPNNKAMFDIGVAGPIAGFIASVAILIYGFTHLPGVGFILSIHPDYFLPTYGKSGLALKFGDSILFSFLRTVFTNHSQFVPPMSEIYHYPFLCVGWFGLFVTSMNMIPVGQLDGGHIIYSMFGEKKHFMIAQVSMGILVILGLIGIGDSFLNWNTGFGWTGWLFWGLVLFLFIKVKHPTLAEYYPLDRKRMFIGYMSIFILIISFSPSPISLSLGI